MRWARLALGASLTLALTAQPVAAQRVTPVRGGGSFSEAPVLEAGRYTDSIRMSEELFYAVELAAGQTLKVTARLLGDRAEARDSFGTGQLHVYNPVRDRWSGNQLVHFDGASNSKRFSIETREIGAPGDEFDSDVVFFSQPGTYYFSLRFFRIVGPDRQSSIFRRQYDTHLVVRLAGTPATPSPSPSPAPEPTPTETGDPGAAAPSGGSTSGSDDEAPYLRVYLMTFLIGLLVGFGAMALRGLMGRPPPPATQQRGT